MIEIFKIDEEVLCAEQSSPLEVSKDFSRLREKDCDQSFYDEVNILFNFSLIFSEEVSMISLTK